jgi:phage terminase large subunit-like protein
MSTKEMYGIGLTTREATIQISLLLINHKGTLMATFTLENPPRSICPLLKFSTNFYAIP